MDTSTIVLLGATFVFLAIVYMKAPESASIGLFSACTGLSCGSCPF